MENRFKDNQMDIISRLSEIFMSEEPTEDLLKLVSDTYNFNTHDLKTELDIFNRMFNQKYDTSVSEKLEAKIDYTRQNYIQKSFPLITVFKNIFNHTN